MKICATLFAAAFCAIAVNADEFRYDGRVYNFVAEQMPWADAEYNCVAKYNGHLASFHNATQLSAVYYGVGATGSPWIGLTDSVTEDTWAWTDKSTVNFTPWSSNQPDNWQSNEDCVQTSASSWNDLACSSSLSSICLEHENADLSDETGNLISSLIDKKLDPLVSSSGVNNGESSSGATTGTILSVVLLGAVATVVGIGYISYKKRHSMASPSERTSLIERDVSFSTPDVQSNGASIANL